MLAIVSGMVSSSVARSLRRVEFIGVFGFEVRVPLVQLVWIDKEPTQSELKELEQASEYNHGNR